jgi:hypothetical protein
MAIWGVADPQPAALNYVTAGPGSDVAVTSSTATTVITTGAIVMLNPGPYYPLIWGVLTIVLGGTAPSALIVTFILGAGSAVDTYTVLPALLVNSATLVVPVFLVGVNSATAWIGSGSTINLQVTATGQAVTVKGVGSRMMVGLFRGPEL